MPINIRNPDGSYTASAAGTTLPTTAYSASGGTTATPINSTVLTPQSAIQLPPAPTDTTNYQADTAGYTAMATANASALTPLVDPANTSTSNLQKQLEAMFPKPTSTADTYQSTYGVSPETARANETAAQNTFNVDQAAVQAAQDKYNALNAQLAGFQYQQNALIPAQVEGQNIGRGSMSAIEGQTREALRDNMLRAAPVQFQALIAQAELASAQGKANLSQGILQQAQGRIDDFFKAQVADNAAQYKYRTDIIDKVYDFATKAEQNRLDEMKTQKANEFTVQRDALNYAQTLAGEAMKNGQADISAKILALNPKSATYQADVSDLAQQAFENTGNAKGTTTTVAGLNTGKTFVSGQLQYSPTQYQSDQQELIATRGPDGWVDPAAYLTGLKNWTTKGGLQSDFLQLYPIKDYVNPLNTWPQITALGGGTKPKSTSDRSV
ncbi:MAG: hypothetical protein Q7S26_04270 [bacterium]|nr:hypothetical protein [bacterium]